MNCERLNEIRQQTLLQFGADQNSTAQILEYCANPFDKALLTKKPVFPLDDEPHTEDWRRYLSESGDNPFAYLQEKIPQLNIPIKEGMSKTDAYANAAKRGKPFEEKNFSGRLTLKSPDKFLLYIHKHPAGALPVMVTSEREDFEKLYWALGCRCEPTPMQKSVNAHMIAGFINWDRVHCYQKKWEESSSPDSLLGGWGGEMRRAAKEEPWRFKDRFIILFKNSYSSLSADELGLDISETEWLEKSTALRTEHEFTHYATKRLYGKMRNNLLDETIADYMGITAAFGKYKAEWFLKFMGLENFPEIRESGRIFTYSRELDANSFRLLCGLLIKSSNKLEEISGRFYDREKRGCFLLALTSMTLELLAAENADALFEEFYGEAEKIS